MTLIGGVSMTLRGVSDLEGGIYSGGGGVIPHDTVRCGLFPPLACLFAHYLYDDSNINLFWIGSLIKPCSLSFYYKPDNKN